MKKKLFLSIISTALILALAGCGKDRPAENYVSAEPQVTEDGQLSAKDEGQNPVMNFVGVYNTATFTEALVEAEGIENAKITVTYADNPWFHKQTVMSGCFDPETLTMEFNNATLTEYTYNSDGSVDEETVSYNDGKGRAVFDAVDNTLTITEETPYGDNETVYIWGPSSEMKYVSEPDHYASVTAMDKAKIETVVGFNVRTAYLSQDWFTLADMIRYPITINDTELADADAFLGYMMDKTVAESDWQAMNDEDYLDMFVNDEGIMMGDGEIWLSDPNYMTDGEPTLEIIAINGIVSKDAESDTAIHDEDE